MLLLLLDVKLQRAGGERVQALQLPVQNLPAVTLLVVVVVAAQIHCDKRHCNACCCWPAVAIRLSQQAGVSSRFRPHLWFPLSRVVGRNMALALPKSISLR
jgi:hypothetical protein